MDLPVHSSSFFHERPPVNNYLRKIFVFSQRVISITSPGVQHQLKGLLKIVAEYFTYLMVFVIVTMHMTCRCFI